MAEYSHKMKALIGNPQDWYVVTMEDDSWRLMHQKALSSILDHGQDKEDFGYVEIQQCGNEEDLTVG